jgi:hypothetical protein
MGSLNYAEELPSLLIRLGLVSGGLSAGRILKTACMR